jgi:hypothetical protein
MVDSPVDLRALAAKYRSLAKVSEGRFRYERLALAEYIEKLADEREASEAGEQKRQRKT